MSDKQKLKIGRGLFSDEPVWAVAEEIAGDPKFLLSVVTMRDGIEMLHEGFDFDADNRPRPEMIDAAVKRFKKHVHGWENLAVDGKDIPFEPKWRDRLAETEAFGIVIGLAKGLGAAFEETEEKNSESSLPGTSEPVTSP